MANIAIGPARQRGIHRYYYPDAFASGSNVIKVAATARDLMHKIILFFSPLSGVC